MKLPNGYGGIHKLSGNRRKPWCARKTVGWEISEKTGRERAVYKYIGYYSTRKEALQALADFNENPYDIDPKSITLSEIYDAWSKVKYEEVVDTRGYVGAWKALEQFHDTRIQDMNIDAWQQFFDNCPKNKPMQRVIKTLVNQLYAYACARDYVSSNKVEMIKSIKLKAGNPNSFKRAPFSKKEIKKVWDNVNANEYMTVVLILIYTGVRIAELLELKREDVHLEERWFKINESKTKAGIREVPIADKIFPFVEKWYNRGAETLICTPEDKPFGYRNYYDSYWKPMMDLLKLEHRPHDTRHTCVSLLTEAQIDPRIIKQIVGHKGQGVTESVYTHIDIKNKLDAINQI